MTIKRQSVATTIMYMMEEWGESNTLHILEKRMNKRTLTREEYKYIHRLFREYRSTNGRLGYDIPFMASMVNPNYSYPYYNEDGSITIKRREVIILPDGAECINNTEELLPF